MQTIDINGKTLSNSFQSALTSYSQFIKPRVVIDFQDARHLSNVSITTNSDNASGLLGTYFNKEQVLDGIPYETFSWGVCDVKDNLNKVITANGKYRAMPSDLTDNLKYGWWSNSKSDASGLFVTNPYVDITFAPTTINKVKVITSRNLGQIKSFTVAVAAGNTTLLNQTISFDTNNDEFEKIINLDSTYANVSRVLITVVSTKNPEDYARIVSVSPMYQMDISDYIIDTAEDRVRDLHETSLPIAGTSQTSSSITIDNSSKKFNILNTNSDYGKYLQKDVKVNISHGWKSYESTDNIVESYLTSNISSSATSVYVSNLNEFPYGDTANTNLESNYYIVTIDKNLFQEEKILVKKKTIISSDIWGLEVAERGYAGTTASSHSANAVITFDPFEYVEIGTFFIEEVSSSTSDMTVQISLQDRFKFLNDKVLEKGFFKENTTVGDAVEDLLYFGNTPNHKIIKYNRFQDSPSIDNAILHLKFNDDTKNAGNSYVGEGLRYRVYQPAPGFEYTIKDLQLDTNEKVLSDLDKALGLSSSVSPSYVGIKSNVELISYNLSTDNASLNNKFYQGVFDGYFVPITTAVDEEIGVEIDEGGFRLYIDDNLLINGWNEKTSLAYYSATYSWTAGIPYKIRLEFYHSGNNDTFDLNLTKTSGRATIGSTELLTNVVLDSIGSRNAGFTGSNKNRHRNNAIPSAFVNFTNESSMTWNTDDKSIYLSNTISGGSTVDSFIRLPYDTSWDVTSNSTNTNRDWSIEYVFKSPQGGLGASGEYISSWSNSSSTAGIEFFYISSTNHGVKLKILNTSNSATATSTITSSTTMPEPNGWNHVITTYDYSDNVLKYYVDGIQHGSATLTNGYEPDFGTNHLTFGGRGSSFTSGVGVVKPTSSINISGINVYIDEFIIYNKCISATNALKRYRETQIKEIKKFPFLYSINESIYQAIQNITFSDLGRIFVDENDNIRYDNYYEFFETSIDQHANVQKSISDEDFIVDASIQKTLQVNSVIIKISGVVANTNETQPIWRAPDPTTLGVVTLSSNLSNSANTIPASSFDLIPFPTSGYIVIDSEIIKYSNKNNMNFLSVERGVLGTTAASHNSNSLIREVRYFNFEYDKTPALNVKNPFITGILFEDPDEINILHWSASPFKGNLIISASESIGANNIAFAEGTNPITQKVAFASIAGIPIQVSENKNQIIEQKAVNSENRRKYGLKEIVIDSPFITNAEHAQSIANFIIEKLSEPIPILEVNTVLMPTLQVGDRIRITTLDQFDIINSDYWVISISTSVGSGYSQTMTLRKVV
jgi:hypothetical protein